MKAFTTTHLETRAFGAHLRALLLLFLLPLSISAVFGQKVAVVGIDHSSPSVGGGDYDGISFVATENLVAGTVFYFTNGLYDAPNTRFRSLSAGDDGIKFIAKYTVPAGGVAKGVVVYIQETNQTSNVLATTCSSGSCGTAAFLVYNGAASNFSIGSIVMGVWAYSDGDDNPLNGITTIHSVLYEGFYDSGTGVQTVGNLPTTSPNIMNPTGSFPNAIVTDGLFSTVPPSQTISEFKPSLRGGAVSKLNLEDPTNYNINVTGATTLSTTAFASLNLVATNPTMGVTLSPSSVTENGAPNLTYTFTLSANAASNITVNYTATGTATNGTDYGAVSGTVVIASGTNTATVIVNPTGDATLEPDETVTLTVVAGTGYDIGSPSSATGTITNDDTGTSLPKVALVGINHADPSVNPSHFDGFSFVALEDIAATTVVHFTRRIYDKTTLAFGNTFTGTVKWTAGSGVNRGDVYTLMETSADVFTATCSDGSSCGTATNIDAGFTIPSGGITLFAYADNNDNPTDGVTEIYSALHTGDLSVGNGGAIPSISNPSAIYPNAVVVDNFPNATPSRVEYDPTKRNVTVSRTALVNTANWLHGQSTATVPSTVRFTNIIVTSGVANPLVTVTASPSSVLENSGTGMVYTFTLSANATSNITVNFGVSGTATFGTDYTASGATSFTVSTGSVVIASGSNSASVTLTPTADATLEPNETAILTIDLGTGYDSGSPSVATGTIVNDDIVNVNPLVVIVGVNHGTSPDPDGISFAANQNLAAGTEIYFTDSPYNNTTLTFSAIESVTKYTVPAGGLAKGQVVYIVETGQLTNAFTVSCSAGSNCGTFSFISGDFSISSNGEDFYAYSDTDGDPTNGITAIHSLFYAINATIPTTANPSSVFPNAVVVSGFGNSLPNRTEYKFASNERAAAINLAAIQSTSNYLIAQTTQALSVVPFAALDVCPATVSTHPTNTTICAASSTTFSISASGSNLTYQWQVNTGSGFANITNGGVYSGGTTATLTLTAVPAFQNGYTYQCVVNDCRTSNSATLTVQSPQGTPSVFGTNTWNVYAWNAGGGTIASAGNWTTNYSGFYTNSNLSFNTTTSWANTLSPSSAVTTANTTAYQGCTVPNDVHSWSAKRQGFPCSLYQLDIPTHNDAVQLWVNGTKVYELDAAGSNHTNVWTGFLGTTDQVEFRVTEGTGGSEGQLTLTALSFPATTTNNALNFDGANDYVAIKNCSGAALDVLNAITIEYWFKGSNLQSAVRLQNGSGYIVAGWNGTHIISSDGGTTGGLSVGANAMNGNWHHVAMTWQRNTANGFKSYLDGQLVAQRTSLDVALPSINSGMYLGAFNGSSEFMNGSLDEVRVWNVVRTQAEIQAGVNGCTFTLPQANLVVYYKFDHGSGGNSNSGINIMVNSANATTYPAALNNFALTGATSNWTAVSCAILPIELTSINVTAQPTNNLLTWTTVSEVNVAHFAIERSTDGINFEKIGQIKAQGKGTTYEFLDNIHPLSIAYYRVRSIDNDGTESISKIVSITRKATGSLKVYPSIATNYLNIETDLTDNFSIINALGQVQMTGKIANYVDINALPIGVYVFRIGQAQAKFVKQ
jgi:hypothetical protein